MKHKILVSGRNMLLVTDFIQHTETFFDTLSSSVVLSDIIGHFRFFQPDVYVAFLDANYEQSVRNLTDLKNSDFYNGALLVLVADADICSQIERRQPHLGDLVIRRPVTADNIVLKINHHMDEITEMKERQIAHVEKMEQMDALIKAAEAALSEASVPTGAADAQAPVTGKKHILIVDDDRTVLKMLKTALDGTYDVTTMANGAMIDKLLVAKRVDLIVLDYEMPVETGADIFRRLKKNPKSAQIPVCFLTGVSDRAKIMEVMSLKPHGYILKPIDMDMLSSTIKNLIG